MELVEAKRAFRACLGSARSKGASVGLVPTMGALHDGHLSLIRAARDECDTLAVSIFVNPTQFGDASDLAAYPRELESDLAQCGAAGVDMVFAPSVAEMYPFGEPAVTVDPGPLGSILEGTSRRGHFAGVTTVVTKLFSLAGTCRAYFGEKDFQQLAIVRRTVQDLELDVEVRGCPTVREADGLAMSSRNTRLDASGREAAVALWRSLEAGRALIAAGEQDSSAVMATMRAVLGQSTLVVADYTAVADPFTLSSVEEISGEVRLLVAARVEPVRLIDNLAAIPPAIAGNRAVGK